VVFLIEAMPKLYLFPEHPGFRKSCHFSEVSVAHFIPLFLASYYQKNYEIWE